MLTKNVSLTLMENSTAGNPPKIFTAQHVDITHETDTRSMSADGMISVATHPSTILWHGGRAEQLKNITGVEIVASNGEVLVHGELNTTQGVPRDENKGVIFFVLRSN